MKYCLIVVFQEHKCKECGKMLGNNKRRLLHFGVHHAHVLPLVSSHLRALGPQEEERDEDGFEVTLDPIVNSPVKRPKTSPEVKEPKVVKETKIIRKFYKYSVVCVCVCVCVRMRRFYICQLTSCVCMIIYRECQLSVMVMTHISSSADRT